jgi:hypothetical protein
MSENEIASLAVRYRKDELQSPIPPNPDFAENNDDKRGRYSVTELSDTQPQTRRHAVGSRLGSLLWRFEQQLVEYNLEARGIERVGEDERMKRLSWVSYLQAFLLWVSINLAANNITLGMLGPAVYGLSFRDSALCGVFGALVGAIVASWMATWGPVSGIRTMVGTTCFLSD